MSSLTRTVSALALVGAMSLGLAACSSDASTAPADGADTLRLALGNAPTSFDPAQMGDAGNMLEYAQAVYDSLLYKAPDGTIEPWLASEWSYNDDRTELTLVLRDDVSFANGEKFNADVAVANLTHFKEGNGPQAGMLAEVTDISAADEYTVVITLSAPNPSLESYLTTVAGLQVSPEGLESADLATVPSGSGPYSFNASESTTGNLYEFNKREDYWNPDIVDFDNVEIRVIADAAAMANAFASGQVDAAPASVETLSQFENAGAQIDTVEGDWTGFMMFDREGQLLEPLEDVRVRQAFNYAIDRDQVLETVQRGYGSLTTQIFSEDDPAYVPELDDAYGYDPDKAKQLLDEAGYGDGFDVTMVTYTGMPADTLAVYAQQLEAIGIRVTWETQDVNTWLTSMTTGKSAINVMQLGAKGGWEMINQLVAPSAPWNPLHDETDELNEMIHAVQFAADDATLAAALQDVNRYLVDNAWFAPWYRVASPYATNPDVLTVDMQFQQTLPSLYNFAPAK